MSRLCVFVLSLCGRVRDTYLHRPRVDCVIISKDPTRDVSALLGWASWVWFAV